jgi:hypothetical protein
MHIGRSSDPTKLDSSASASKLKARVANPGAQTVVPRADAGAALGLYLQDHHAAGTAGSAIADRLARNVTMGYDARKELAEVAADIRSDLRTLEAIMAAQEIRTAAVKDILARTGVALGSLKLNGRLRGRSPLSDVLELETMLAGVTAKAALWNTLQSVPLQGTFDVDELSARAEKQRATLRRWRDAASDHIFRT